MAARDLARDGARVALVDGSHPREKPCGGGVTGRALELIRRRDGGVCRSTAGQSIRRVRFEAGANAATVDLPAGYLDVFSREEFDRALFEQAVQAGAETV